MSNIPPLPESSGSHPQQPQTPFGDPTAIEQEKRSAIGKGVLFGCGGCSAIIVGIIGIFVLVMGVIMYSIRYSDATAASLKAAQESVVMKAELGEPITLGLFVSGNISIRNSDGRVDVSVPVSGPKGSATIHTIGTKKGGGAWVFTLMNAVIAGSGKEVDLLKK